MEQCVKATHVPMISDNLPQSYLKNLSVLVEVPKAFLVTLYVLNVRILPEYTNFFGGIRFLLVIANRVMK